MKKTLHELAKEFPEKTYRQLDIKDSILNWIERVSGRIHNWAWDKRFKYRDPDEWIKGYKEWKKK